MPKAHPLNSREERSLIADCETALILCCCMLNVPLAKYNNVTVITILVDSFCCF